MARPGGFIPPKRSPAPDFHLPLDP